MKAATSNKISYFVREGIQIQPVAPRDTHTPQNYLKRRRSRVQFAMLAPGYRDTHRKIIAERQWFKFIKKN